MTQPGDVVYAASYFYTQQAIIAFRYFIIHRVYESNAHLQLLNLKNTRTYLSFQIIVLCLKESFDQNIELTATQEANQSALEAILTEPRCSRNKSIWPKRLKRGFGEEAKNV